MIWIKFSFIIPTKNEEAYIGGCLESIKKQRKKNYETVIVDSYSSDKTVKIASKYGAKVLFERRKGPAAARNTGAKNAVGDILVFADADVRFGRDFIDNVETAFMAGAMNIGGAIFRLEAYDAEGKAVDIAYKFANVIVNFLNRLGITMTLGSCFVFEKKIFNAVGGFDAKLLTNEDHDIAMRVSKEKRVMYFPEIVVYTSSRRVTRYGLFKLIGVYAESTLLYFFKHKSLRHYWY